MQIEQIKTSDLLPYARNSRTHSDAQIAQIAASIKEFGFTNPVLIDNENQIIAGHGRVMASLKLKMKEVPCIRLGYLTEIQKRAYVIADNKLALNAGWDDELLALEIGELKSEDFKIDLLGFDHDELSKLLADEVDKLDDNNPYTMKIQAPIYEPTGEKPALEELYSDEKAMDLIVTIKESKLNEKEKHFLMAAASRHIIFDYAKIANFYAHSSEECQKLMEDSALVIIDFNKAIEGGFVRFTQEINDMFETDTDE